MQWGNCGQIMVSGSEDREIRLSRLAMPDIPTAIICFSHTNTNPLSIAELILCLSTPQLDGTGNTQLGYNLPYISGHFATSLQDVTKKGS
jgi:hypothetical protein